jgi:hypothetical protein
MKLASCGLAALPAPLGVAGRRQGVLPATATGCNSTGADSASTDKEADQAAGAVCPWYGRLNNISGFLRGRVGGKTSKPASSEELRGFESPLSARNISDIHWDRAQWQAAPTTSSLGAIRSLGLLQNAHN